eukprot:1085452-Prorocentrum_minimum.AAC.2
MAVSGLSQRHHLTPLAAVPSLFPMSVNEPSSGAFALKWTCAQLDRPIPGGQVSVSPSWPNE